MIRLIVLVLMLGLLSVPAWTQQPAKSAAVQAFRDMSDQFRMTGDRIKDFADLEETDKAVAAAQIKYWSDYARGDDELVKYWSDYARGIEKMAQAELEKLVQVKDHDGGVVVGGQSMPVEQVPSAKPPGYNFNLPTKLPAKP